MAAKDGPKVSVTMKNIIFDLSDQGCSTVKICKTLQQEFDFRITRQAILYILKTGISPLKERKTPDNLQNYTRKFLISGFRKIET